MTTPLYRHSLALLTDLYQLTMAYGYWRQGLAEREAVFHLTYRRNPYKGGFAVAAGLKPAMDFLESLRFDSEDLAYLQSLVGADEKPLFEPAFLSWLGEQGPCLSVDGIEEGTVVFPHEPLIRVRGPLAMAQIVETPLLNIVNFQTLIATRAARICLAAEGDAVMEFGLRRAQGIDGGLAASRAAYVGGVGATSNVLAGKLYGIPVKGTHAHAWVMAFPTEREAFEAYADAMPNNCIFLVDTYDTLEGTRAAAQVGHFLRQRGHDMLGVRLDSGDLAALSIEVRRILDAEGFRGARIVASNDLDEHRIRALKQAGATIDTWGVGTRLSTAHGQSALGGVYKLAALRQPDGSWSRRLKLSETPIKISNPGIQQVRRFTDGDALQDLIYDELAPPSEWASRDQKMVGDGVDLLVPVLRDGRVVYSPPTLAQSRERALAQVAALPPSLSALTDSAPSPVSLEAGLADIKEALIASSREKNS
ncbi:MAG: nicotinate phosphoribosyltransferase [Myxococcota bacterium]